MTFYQFKKLGLNEQAQYTWENGILLGSREVKNYHMVLYSVDDFYVEIQYQTIQNEISRVKSFMSDHLLDPYLDKIDLTGLLQDL